MRLNLVNSTTVIVARQFNPSIVRDRWLVNNGLLAPEDFEEGCAFTDAFANVVAREFNLLVVPDQLQFVPKVVQQRQQELVLGKVGGIVENLPHTPYIAIGLNYTWHLHPETTTIEDLSRQLFYVSGRPLYDEFETADSRFGAYFSKDMLKSRLKLDIKPVNTPPLHGQQAEAIQFAFNFHRDIEGDTQAVTRIIDALKTWDESYAASERMMHKVANGGGK